MTDKPKKKKKKPNRKKKRRAQEARMGMALVHVPKAEVGRPLTLVNWDVIDAVLECFGTLDDCAAVLRCNRMTILRACLAEKGMSFVTYASQKDRIAKLSLRRTQLLVAKGYFVDELGPGPRDPFDLTPRGLPVQHSDGRNGKEQPPVEVAKRVWVPPDRTMLIWTGKQYLGQEDKPGIPGLAKARAELAALLGIEPEVLPSVQADELEESKESREPR